MENLEYWYKYGFSGIIDDAAAMERAAGIEYITREVATFAKCDPNFKNSDAAGNPAFIFNFSLYLAGRADERRECQHWDGEPLGDWQPSELGTWDSQTADWQPDELPEWADGLHLRKQERKPEPPTLEIELPPLSDGGLF